MSEPRRILAIDPGLNVGAAMATLMMTPSGRMLLERYLGPRDELTLLMGGDHVMVSLAEPFGVTPHHHQTDPVAAKAPTGSFSPELPEVTDLDRRRIADADHKRRMRAERLSRTAAKGAFR